MKSIDLNRALDIIDNAVLNFESCDIVDAFGYNRYDNERILFENNAVFKKEIFDDEGNFLEASNEFLVDVETFKQILNIYFYRNEYQFVSDFYF